MLVALCWALLQDHPWSGFGEGATVTVRTTSVTGKVRRVKEETFTIARVAEFVTVRVETKEDGNVQTREDTWRPGVDAITYSGTEKGKQDLTIDGTKLACTILEQTVTSFAGQSTTRRWICKDAPTPGGLVKEETSGTAGNSASVATFRLTKLKETVKVKGQSFSCWVVETSGEDEVMKTKAKAWYSRQMPGTLVKSETTLDTGGSEPTKVTIEVVAVDLRK